MIGSLFGKIKSIRHPTVIIEVSGVGYEVDLPLNDCSTLSIGSEAKLFTHLTIREDAHLLFGFLTLEGRDSFRSLIKVSGVGPKIALALLSTLSLDELEYALEQGSIDLLCKTPGIGKKVAERMILELKGKFIVNREFNLKVQPNVIQNRTVLNTDLSNALASLGYNDKEIVRVIKSLPAEIDDLSLGIKEALKLLNKF